MVRENDAEIIESGVANLGTVRVLCVCDDRCFNEMRMRLIEMIPGLELVRASSEDEALRELATSGFDAVLCDYSVSEIDGHRLLRSVRGQYGHIPFIALASEVPVGSDTGLSEDGPDAYIRSDTTDAMVRSILPTILRESVRRWRAEESLRTNEDMYRTFVQQFPGISYQGNLDFETRFMHGPVEEITGYPLEDFTASRLRWDQLVHPDDVRSLHELADKFKATPGHSESRLYRIVRKDGAIRWVHEIANNVVDESGRPYLVQGVILDITEGKTAENLLRMAKEHAENLIQNANAIVVAVQNDGLIRFFNDEAEKLTGYLRDDVQGRNWRDVFADESSETSMFSILGDERIWNEPSVPYLEASMRSKTGEEKFVSWQISRMLLGGESDAVFIGFDITERRKTEQALRDTMARLEEIDEIIDSSPVTVLIWSDQPGWPVRFVSKNISRFGYSQDDLLSGRLKYSDLIHPDDVIRLEAEIRSKTGKGIRNWHHEYRIMTTTGEIRWVDERTTAVRDIEGAVVRLHGVIFDITSRKEAEEQVSESERKYRTLFDNASDGIFIIDLDGRFLDVNMTAVTSTGYSRYELMTKTIFDLERPDLASSFNERRDKIESIGEDSYEFVLIRKDGSELPLEINVRLIDYSGRPALLAIARDTTERKMAEDALRTVMASLEELETIVNASPAVVFRWTFDGERKVQFVTNSVRQFGYPPSELLAGNPSYSSIILPEDRGRILGELMDHHKNSDREFTLEYRVITKDGNVRWVDDRTTVRPGDKGGIDYHQGIVMDITARKQAEEALRLANEKLNLMGSITRHDVMNQIGIIMGALTLMEDDKNERDRINHHRLARDACSTVIMQLEFAGSYQKAGTKAPEWVHMRLDLAGALSSLDIGDVRVEQDLGNIEIWADPMFEKVMFNLIDNSLRHGKNVNRIGVHAVIRGKRLFITYEDDGAGVLPESKELIFDKGYGRNTGLGLFLCREILSMTNITIQEVGEYGKGARFEIVVPPGKFRDLGAARK